MTRLHLPHAIVVRLHAHEFRHLYPHTGNVGFSFGVCAVARGYKGLNNMQAEAFAVEFGASSSRRWSIMWTPGKSGGLLKIQATAFWHLFKHLRWRGSITRDQLVGAWKIRYEEKLTNRWRICFNVTRLSNYRLKPSQSVGQGPVQRGGGDWRAKYYLRSSSKLDFQQTWKSVELPIGCPLTNKLFPTPHDQCSYFEALYVITTLR